MTYTTIPSEPGRPYLLTPDKLTEISGLNLDHLFSGYIGWMH